MRSSPASSPREQRTSGLGPRSIGRNIHLHPLVVILAVLAGVELDGIAGIFIAVPVVALITVVGRHWLEWRGRDVESLPIVPAAAVAEKG